MIKERHDFTGSSCLKEAAGRIVVNKNGINDMRKKYVENLMNDENEWDHEVSSSVKEAPADCIMISAVIVALRIKEPQAH